MRFFPNYIIDFVADTKNSTVLDSLRQPRGINKKKKSPLRLVLMRGKSEKAKEDILR